MKTSKSILLFFASFIIVGFLVILIAKIFPNSPASQTDFQAYSKRSEIFMSLDK